MHMGLRFREVSHTKPSSGGYRRKYNAGGQVEYVVAPSTMDYRAQCTDEGNNPGVDHSLRIDTYRIKMDNLSGHYDGNYTNSIDWVDFPLYEFAQINNPSHLPVSGFDTDANLALQLIVKTNPNKYAMNGPVSFLELRDLPRMVKKQGDSIIENAAGGYLSWQFGWKPLISDLRKLLDFNKLVDKKVGELTRLYGGQGLHRKRSFGTKSVSEDSAFNIISYYGADGYLSYKRRTWVEKWGSVRYKPTALPPKDKAELRRQAIKIVYGLELSPANLWEALPWSWLVDWFTNVGDYLSTYNNVVPVAHSTPCIMTRTTTKATFARADTLSQVSGGNGSWTYQTKIRSVVSPASLTASLPFLTDRQLSILGSLAVLRLK